MDRIPKKESTPVKAALKAKKTQKRKVPAVAKKVPIPVEQPKAETDAPVVPVETTSATTGKRLFQCAKCQKTYKSPGGLWDHQHHSKSCGTEGPRIRPNKKRKSQLMVGEQKIAAGPIVESIQPPPPTVHNLPSGSVLSPIHVVGGITPQEPRSRKRKDSVQ